MTIRDKVSIGKILTVQRVEGESRNLQEKESGKVWKGFLSMTKNQSTKEISKSLETLRREEEERGVQFLAQD